jgi:LPS-assembly protein
VVAEGNVVATYGGATLRAQTLTYTPATETVVIEGEVEITRETQWLKGSRAEINISDDTGIIYDASGFSDELFVAADSVTKVGPDTYIATNGFLSACEDDVPKWSFRSKSATIQTSGNAKISHTLFRVKKVPIFYFPYMILPTGRKERSSGLLLPTTGSSNNKGRRISQSVYLVLGRSADVTYQADWFTERGLGHRGIFRTRPNEASTLYLDFYTVDDRKDQGGASLEGFGETRFGQGFRGVADFNLVSSFEFRQVFSDNFFRATKPNETSRVFVTNNFQSKSINMLVSNEETLFPQRPVVIQTLPGFSFRMAGQRLGSSSLYLDLDGSVEAMRRRDAMIETPGISQRLDLFPRLYLDLPSFQGLKLTPTLGARETFYSNSLTRAADEISVSGESLHRQYVDFSMDIKGWGLSKVYYPESGRKWKHLIEPTLRYRYITGIDNFHQLIRFDEKDAIANTNEVEYSLFNRFFVDAETGAHEWLSVKLSQKYFFEPSFGGAVEENSINQFFPLNTLSGIPYLINERKFSPITGLVRFTPQAPYSFDLRGDYDFESERFRNFSVTGFFNRHLLSLATTYFVTNELLEGFFAKHQLQGSAGLGDFTKGISSVMSFSYDMRESRLLNHLIRVSYNWDCCGISAEVFGFNLSAREERQFRFSFFLKGIGSFGTIRRPDNVF